MDKGKILVTGGAGFIGSHAVSELIKQGYEVMVVDSLERGNQKAIFQVPLKVGSLADKDFLEKVFSEDKFAGVMHFSGYIAMGESYENPGMYFENNVGSSVKLLDAMGKFKVKNIVFSSTAGVYGNPVNLPIKEEDPKSPTNPYGESKLTVERILPWYEARFGIKYMNLRYFNAAGASLDGSNGEDHRPETHIIPLAMRAVLKKESFKLFGDDYSTEDGTGVRDYIHVLDLAESHILALESLMRVGKSNYFNLGVGKGYSNKEVLDMVKKVTGQDFEIEVAPRRKGDASQLYADNSKIKQELGFEPKYSDLETIVKTAWEWHKNHPNGFEKEVS